MKHNRLAACVVLVFAVQSGISAQDTSSIFAPFVSHLQAQTSGTNEVELAWTDSPSVRGPVFIFRAQRPFEGKAPRDNLCGEARYGEQRYTDTAPHQGTWYYYVAAADENRIPFEIVVPLHNMLEILVDERSRTAQAAGFSAPVDAPQSAFVPPPTPTAAAEDFPRRTPFLPPSYQPAQSNPPPAAGTITGIAALPEENGIRVLFLALYPAKNAVIYRNITPVTRISDLLTADVAHLPGAKSPFFDAAQAGIPYYYAVVYDEDLRAGTASIIPGQNATVYPAAVPPAAAAPTAPPSKLSLEAEAALERAGLTPIPYLPPAAHNFEPQVFQQDLNAAPADSEESRLNAIVKDSFTWRRWNRAIPELQSFIVLSKNPGNAARARFYLGQALFLSGAKSAALTEFLAVQSRFPAESERWIQRCLN